PVGEKCTLNQDEGDGSRPGGKAQSERRHAPTGTKPRAPEAPAARLYLPHLGRQARPRRPQAEPPWPPRGSASQSTPISQTAARPRHRPDDAGRLQLTQHALVPGPPEGFPLRFGSAGPAPPPFLGARQSHSPARRGGRFHRAFSGDEGPVGPDCPAHEPPDE